MPFVKIDSHGTIDSVDLEERLTAQVSSLEAWYSEEFERRLGELAQILNAELQTRIQEVQRLYEQRLTSDAVAQPAQISPISHESLEEEITRTEADMAKCSSELERMVADDSVALGKLLQTRTKELELKAYIRGLRFLTLKGSNSSTG